MYEPDNLRIRDFFYFLGFLVVAHIGLAAIVLTFAALVWLLNGAGIWTG